MSKHCKRWADSIHSGRWVYEGKVEWGGLPEVVELVLEFFHSACNLSEEQQVVVAEWDLVFNNDGKELAAQVEALHF